MNDLCRVEDYAGPHNFIDATFDGVLIPACSRCGKKSDGSPHSGLAAYRQFGELPEGMARCPYSVTLQSWKVYEDKVISRVHFIGCHGHGLVSANHPARTRSTRQREPREEHAMTTDPDDGFICMNCRGTGTIRVGV